MSHNQITLKRLARALDAAAQLVEMDPGYRPIFERLDEEYRFLQALAARRQAA
jgi:hypothetical protein